MTEPSNETSQLDPSILADTLFVVWGFPEPSQTFIHRELIHMEQLGGEVRMLAGPRRRHDGADPALAAIVGRTIFLGPEALWAARGLAWAARHPRRFAHCLRAMSRLGHRTHWHRRRAGLMALAAASVVDRVRASGVRYVHAHFAGYQTELAMALGELLDLPYGATFHAVGIWRDANALEDGVAGAESILTCTRHNIDHLRSLAAGDDEHVHLGYHGLDLDSLPSPAPYPSEDGAPRFLAIGRLVPKKGFDSLVRAVRILADDGLDVHVTILGDGPERGRLEALVAELDVAGAVELPGSVDNQAVFAQVSRCRALVAPSVRDAEGNIDGIPNVILEAMSMARPIVGSDLSGIPEVVTTGETGVLVPPGDAAAVAAAMREIAEDPDHAGAMGSRGRALVEERFDVARNMRRQLAILDQARAGTRRAARTR